MHASIVTILPPTQFAEEESEAKRRLAELGAPTTPRSRPRQDAAAARPNPEALSVKQLKEAIASRGLDTAGAREKNELVAILVRAQAAESPTKELKARLSELNVDIVGCTEKAELVEKLVEATAAQRPAEPPSSARSCMDSSPPPPPPASDPAKFVAQTIIMGDSTEHALGVESALGYDDDTELMRMMAGGVKAICKEFDAHATAAEKEVLNYILNKPAAELPRPNGSIRDEGHGGMLLADFLDRPQAKAAKLSRPMMLALRLYTCGFEGIHRLINDPLRNRVKPHPFAVTTYFAYKGLRKLRTVAAKSSGKFRTTQLYRGMADMAVADGFEGGTELACMSTTRQLSVALNFAKSAAPLLFRYVSKDFTDRGADVQFLSAYPHEAEYLYPPLTFVKAVRILEEEHDGMRVRVVEVEPKPS